MNGKEIIDIFVSEYIPKERSYNMSVRVEYRDTFTLIYLIG